MHQKLFFHFHCIKKWKKLFTSSWYQSHMYTCNGKRARYQSHHCPKSHKISENKCMQDRKQKWFKHTTKEWLFENLQHYIPQTKQTNDINILNDCNNDMILNFLYNDKWHIMFWKHVVMIFHTKTHNAGQLNCIKNKIPRFESLSKKIKEISYFGQFKE